MSNVLCRALALWVVLLVGASSAHAQTLTCLPSQKVSLVAEMFFGRNMGGRFGVTDAKWSRFLATEVTPRFPDGLTVYDAGGQWRDSPASPISRERTKVLMIVLPGKADDDERLRQVIDAYKTRFHQKSVLLIVRPACVSFDY